MTTHSWYAPTVEIICIITRSLFMYMTYKKIAHKVSENIDGLIWVHTGNEKGSIQCLAQKACKIMDIWDYLLNKWWIEMMSVSLYNLMFVNINRWSHKIDLNSQVLLNLVRKYSTGNSLLDTWLTFYEKAKNNNASIIIHVLNICREWEIEKKITKLSCKQFSLKVSQSAACVDTSRWPTCTLCHWPLVPYTSTTLITPTPVPSVYSCPFNTLTPHRSSSHHTQVLLGSPWLYFGL